MSSGAPSGWRIARLGDVANLFNGKAGGSGGSQLRTFKTRHVYDGFLRLTDPVYAPDERAPRVPKETYLRPGDTLTPNMAHGTIGRVAFVRDTEENWTVDGQIMVVRPKDDAVVGRYIFDWLSRPESKRFLVNLEKGGAFDELRGQTHIYRDDVSTLEILLPPTSEQHRIAAILSSVDEAIEATQALLGQLHAVRKAMMTEVLVRGLPGRHDRFKPTPIGDIPEGWEVTTVGQVVMSCDYGISTKLDTDRSGSAVLRMSNMRDGQLDLSELKFCSTDSVPEDLFLSPGDVLFNRTNSKELVGKVGLFMGADRAVSFASYLLRLRANNERATGPWLAAVMNTESNQARLRRLATPGVSQVNINRTKMLALEIGLPPIDEQEEIVAAIASLTGRASEEARYLGGLRDLKSSLRSALLTGHLRVIPDEGHPGLDPLP